MSKTILGIDLGLKGALAFYDGKEMLIYDMPVFRTDRPQIDLIKFGDIIRINRPWRAYAEKLTPLPQISGKSAFSMGFSEGSALATLASLQVPYTLVRPKDWKADMNCPADKEAARMRASQLLPAHAHNWDLKKHDGRAEAALIALYGFQKVF